MQFRLLIITTLFLTTLSAEENPPPCQEVETIYYDEDPHHLHYPCKISEAMPVGNCWNPSYAHLAPPPTEYVQIDNVLYDCLNPYCLRYVWLPEAPPLFIPLKADPRQFEASVGLRFGDKLFGSPLVDVSYYDMIPIIRFFNLFTCQDQMELDLEGALWAFFKTFSDYSPLINADYYVGGSINYAWDRWAFRLRVFHISSHIGDEFLILHPNFDRKNPSAEYIDLFASYCPIDPLRLYLGIGYIPIRDPSFRIKRFYAEGGLEYYIPALQFVSLCHMISGSPYVAANISSWENHNWNINQTYVLGYEIAKLYGLERKLRLYMQYHNGYSFEGQFCDLRTQYFSLRLSYGF